MKYWLVIVVVGIGLAYLNKTNCLVGREVDYCEHSRFSQNIRSLWIREIREKTLLNLHYIKKKDILGCESIKKVSVNRNVFDKYSLKVVCQNGQIIDLAWDNDKVTVKYDEAFNGNNFLWDDSFIAWWMIDNDSKISESTLDFWYDQQVTNGDNIGLIPREITDQQVSYWQYDDRKVSNPMLLGRVEIELYRRKQDKNRLEKNLPKLIGYFNWVENKRKQSYLGVEKYLWSGWGSGMDNSPRCDESLDCGYSDLIAQQLALTNDIVKIADIIDQKTVLQEFVKHQQRLSKQINSYYKDETDGFVYDLDDNGRKITNKQTIAFVWSLYAKAFDKENANRLVKNYLLNSNKFGGDPWLPSVSRDSNFFDSNGGYWSGGVWPPMVWVGYLALVENNYKVEANMIMKRYLSHFESLWNSEKTMYEYYQPHLDNGKLVPGKMPEAKKDFFGWGILPIKLYNELENL